MKYLLTALVTVSIIVASSSLIMADDDRHERKEHEEKESHRGLFSRFFKKPLDVAPVKNAQYKEECGSCHFAYQAGLLPARSWEKIMANLDNHFDENAELDGETQKTITAYLLKHSADTSDYKRSRRIMNSLRTTDIPVRITQTPYFIRKHDEIPNRLVVDNPQVKSYSKCEACHQNAEKGSYDEHDVHIPGVGKWDD